MAPALPPREDGSFQWQLCYSGHLLQVNVEAGLTAAHTQIEFIGWELKPADHWWEAGHPYERYGFRLVGRKLELAHSWTGHLGEQLSWEGPAPTPPHSQDQESFERELEDRLRDWGKSGGPPFETGDLRVEPFFNEDGMTWFNLTRMEPKTSGESDHPRSSVQIYARQASK